MFLLREALWINDLLKHVNQVVVLPVNVTNDDYWILNLKHITFRF